MIKIKIINTAATLNNFEYLDNIEYSPNFKTVVKFQIFDGQTNIRMIPEVAAKAIAIIQLRDGTSKNIELSMLFNPDDRSLWKMELTAQDTVDMAGSNFQVVLDINGSSTLPDLSDSTDLQTGMAYNVLSKVQFDGEC